MCPDQQLISIYTDGELPSPWKEKIEKHITECELCREKQLGYHRLGDLLAEGLSSEIITGAKESVWQKLEAQKNSYGVNYSAGNETARKRQLDGNFWGRKLAVPFPALAAAAAVIVLFTVIWAGAGKKSQMDNYTARNTRQGGYLPIEAGNEIMPELILTSEKIPVMPASGDMNSVLKYLSSERSDIIIIQLPESRSFNRAGEPEMIRAIGPHTEIPGR